MRIAVWHNLPSGGGKRALYYHVLGLVRRGHTVEVWCPPTADQSYLPLRELVPVHTVPLEWHGGSPRKGLLWGISYYQRLLQRVRGMDRHCQACAAEIHLGTFDLIYANSCKFLAVPPIARHTSLPTALYLGEPSRHLYEARPRLPWIAFSALGDTWWSARNMKHWLDDLMKVQALRLQVREEFLNAEAFTSILVNSFFSRESIMRAYGLDASVCYLGVDCDLFQNQRRLRDNFVASVGSFTPIKNIEFVIRAVARIKSRPRFVWIANMIERPYLKDMKKLARSLQVQLEVKYRIPDDEVVELLNRAAVMAYAPRLEPFGLAPLEANACGLPVVAVAEGGVRETIIRGVNGLLVNSDPEEMAASIEYLLAHRRYAAELGDNGCRLVRENWSLGAALDRLERAFDKALKGTISKPGKASVPHGNPQVAAAVPN